MAKETKAFRLSEATIKRLEILSAQEGITMTDIIESAVAVYLKPDDELTKHLLQVYDSVSDAIQFLENRRDYPEPGQPEIAPGEYWTESERDLCNLLNPLWDELRKHPNFWEPGIRE